MNREHLTQWVEALESGDYPQTTGVLHRTVPDNGKPVGYCCVGVACVVADIPEQPGVIDGYNTFVGASSFAPRVLADWLGLTDDEDAYWGDFFDPLYQMNDGEKLTLVEIAAHLREEYLTEVPA